jgi:hypothetical protein
MSLSVSAVCPNGNDSDLHSMREEILKKEESISNIENKTSYGRVCRTGTDFDKIREEVLTELKRSLEYKKAEYQLALDLTELFKKNIEESDLNEKIQKIFEERGNSAKCTNYIDHVKHMDFLLNIAVKNNKCKEIIPTLSTLSTELSTKPSQNVFNAALVRCVSLNHIPTMEALFKIKESQKGANAALVGCLSLSNDEASMQPMMQAILKLNPSPNQEGINAAFMIAVRRNRSLAATTLLKLGTPPHDDTIKDALKIDLGLEKEHPNNTFWVNLLRDNAISKTISTMKNNQGNDGSIPEEILHSRTRNQKEQMDTTTKPVHQAISSSTHRYPEESKDDWAELGRKNNGKEDEENRAKAASIQSWTIEKNQGNDGSILGKRLHETDQDQEEQIDTGRKVVLDQSWRKDPIQNEEVGMKHHG